MRLGSLCSGYGGLDLAVEAHYGAHLAWCSEVDKDCNQVLAHHWPGVPNLGDLTKVDWDQVEPVDIMCAGFPCQPFSQAGLRKGENDERAIFAYIADAVGVLRPGIVVLENVAGLLTLGGPGVVGTLAGLGYDLRWGIVRASDAGAPHRRARWFCVATDAMRFRRGSATEPCRATAQEATNAVGRRTAGNGNGGPPSDPNDRRRQSIWAEYRLATATHEPCPSHRFGSYEPAIRRWERILGRRAPDPTDDRGLRPGFVEWMMGLPENHVCGLVLSRTAELTMLGNGVCPQQAALALRLLAEMKPD